MFSTTQNVYEEAPEKISYFAFINSQYPRTFKNLRVLAGNTPLNPMIKINCITPLFNPYSHLFILYNCGYTPSNIPLGIYPVKSLSFLVAYCQKTWTSYPCLIHTRIPQLQSIPHFTKKNVHVIHDLSLIQVLNNIKCL